LRARSESFKHAIDIAEHVIVPEAKNAIAVCFQRLGSLSIGNRGRRVLTAVDLHDKTRGMTREVHDVLLDPNLPAEM